MKTRFVALGLLVLGAAGLIEREGRAGPTRYDAEKKSFRLNYTYARLPSEVVMANPGVQSGEPQTPTDLQEKTVHGFLGSVNAALQKATLGNASIESITLVRDVKQADVVIDLTSSSSRGGLAIPLGGDGTGKPGRFYLYYQELARTEATNRQAVVLTSTHELCHYFFGLPDEYRDNVNVPFCPVPPGAGCLMDNYFNRAWSGKLCTGTASRPGDHNPAAPQRAFVGSTQDSCLELVRQFVVRRGGNFDTSHRPSSAVVTSGTPMEDDVPVGLVRRAATLLRRDPRALPILKQAGGGLNEGQRALLRRIALELVRKAATEAIDLSPIEVKVALRVVSAVVGDPLTAEVLARLSARARDLAAKPGGPDKFLKISAVTSQLLQFLRDEKIVASPSPEVVDAVREVATEAVAGPPPVRVESGASDKSGKRESVILAPVPLVAALDTVATQGNPEASYSDIREEGIREFIRLSDRDRVEIYLPQHAADQGIGAKVEVKQADEREIGPMVERDRKLLKLLQKSDPAEYTSRAVDRATEVLREIADRIEKKRLENVTLLVPPGGLDRIAESRAEEFARTMLNRTDVRFDIGLVGTTTISRVLRDLAYRTQGSVLTIIDRDEVGSVAQRLALEQTQGNWVIIPEQGRLDFPFPDLFAKFVQAEEEIKANKDQNKVQDLERKRKDARNTYENAYNQARQRFDNEEAPEKPDGNVPPDQPREQKPLWERLEGTRVRHVPMGWRARRLNQFIALRPFYVDGKSSYELVIGLSQPLRGMNLDDRSIENLRALPRLGFKIGRFTNEQGRHEIEEFRGEWFEALEEDLYLDLDRSTKSTLVFRLPALDNRGLGEAWYTPVLKLKDQHLVDKDKGSGPEAYAFHENRVHYTFSVGTIHPESQVIASLVQDIPEDPQKRATAYRGTLDGTANFAVLQAEVRSGLPIVGAEVTGSAERLEEESNSPIRRTRLTFRDDGADYDLKAGDGIYTATLSLARDRSRGGEYRVFVDAQTVGEAYYIPNGEANQDKDAQAEGPAAARKQDLLAPRFERATSTQFRVEPLASVR
jgi:hypothetical protein